MLLIFIGIIVIVIGIAFAKTESPVKEYNGTIRIVGFLILLIGLGLASVKSNIQNKSVVQLFKYTIKWEFINLLLLI